MVIPGLFCGQYHTGHGNVVFDRPVMYGRLGTEMAAAILSSVLPHDSLWTSDRKLLSPFHKTVNQTFDSVRPSTVCISR